MVVIRPALFEISSDVGVSGIRFSPYTAALESLTEVDELRLTLI